MDIVPLGPGFAAELRGVTLADVAADDATYAAVRAAFEEHSVLVFRDQEISGEGQLEFSSRFGPPESARLDWRPTTQVTLDEDRAGSLLKLLDALEDNDDVQNVYANFDIPDAVMQLLSA